MSAPSPNAAAAIPSFSLSQYEETKQRLRLLAEAQRSKRAAAAANPPTSAASSAVAESAATPTPPAAISESKESGSKPARSAAAARPFTASTLKAAPSARSASTNAAGAAASPISVAPAARPLVRASSARGTTPNLAAAAASAAASPSAAAPAPISSYHPSSSPRAAAAAAAGLGSSGGASGGWTSSRGLTAASVQAQALALNAAIPSSSSSSSLSSPHRPVSLALDGTGTSTGTGGGTGEMAGTTFFPVSTAADQSSGAGTAGSTISSPRAVHVGMMSPRSQGAAAAAAAAADGAHFRPLTFAPSSLPAAPPSAASLAAVYDDAGLFASKLDALLGALRSTAESLGLKYSADSKLLAARNEVESLHALSVRRGNEALQALQAEWSLAHSKIDALAAQYTQALAASKLELSDRIRRLQKSNAISLARAQKDLDLQLRAEYREKEAKQASIEKFNAEKLRTIEEQIRRELKAAAAVDSKKTRASEQALQAQLERLESQGMTLLQSRETELAAALAQVSALQSTVQSSQVRESKWERKASQLSAEKREASETLQKERVQLAEIKQDHQALMHRLSRAEEARATQEQEAAQRASALADAALAQREEADSLRSQISALQSSLTTSANAHALALAALKSKHSSDLDAVSQRVQQLLARKDEQLRELKEKYRAEQEKCREMERFVQEQIG